MDKETIRAVMEAVKKAKLTITTMESHDDWGAETANVIDADIFLAELNEILRR